MGIEDLTNIEILIGIFDILFISISSLTGIKLIYKYFSNKQISFITIGLAWIFLSLTWIAGAISFLLLVLFNMILNRIIFLILANVFSPLSLICWLYSFFKLLYPRFLKNIFILYVLICLIYEIFLFIFIFTNPDIIATFYAIYFYRPKLFTLIFYAFAIITTLITGIIFAIESFKSKNQKLRWKGRFLLLAFVSLITSLILDGTLELNATIYTIIRIIQISSAFEYYFGFFLPNRIANILIREKQI